MYIAKVLLLLIMGLSLVHHATKAVAMAPTDADIIVRLQPPPLHATTSYHYYYDLLELVFAKTESQYGRVTLVTIPKPLSQTRGLNSLNSGLIDITWAGTDLKREREFTPIRIPLIAGL